MKKTQRKDAFRNIRKRIVSYLSICLVIMLGLGGVFITRYMGASIDAEATEYYDSHGFKNYELISSLGITDDDLAQIKDAEGVTDAEGIIRASGSLTRGDLNCNVELISATERISVPEVVEGSAPAAQDECMIGEDTALVRGLKIGDRVRLTIDDVSSSAGPDSKNFTDDEDGSEEAEADGAMSDALLTEEFTITGLMKHPDYLRRKSVDTVVVPWTAIDTEVTDGYYTHALVKAEEPEGVDIFSNRYFEKTAGTKQGLEDLTETLAVDSTARAKQKAYEYIDSEWEKALARLEESQAEIDDGEAQLNDELADARKKLNDAQALLNKKTKDYQKQIEAAQKKIKAAEKKIKDGEKQINDFKAMLKQIDDNLPAIKAQAEEMRKQYKGDLEADLKELARAREILDNNGRYADTDSQEFKDAVKELAQFISDRKDKIENIYNFVTSPEVMELAEIIEEKSGIRITEALEKVRAFDLEGYLKTVDAVLAEEGDINALISKTEELIRGIQDMLAKLDEISGYIKKYEDNRSSLYKQLAEKEKELKAAKAELAAVKKKLADGKALLASEKSRRQAEINSGWNLYYSRKAEYEEKLEEAKALLATNREEAESKLAEAREEVEKIECRWLVLDRRANAGYVDIKSNIAAMNSTGLVFGILFMLISAIVCFSTLTIIIDEQKKMVGTVKAFGFLRHEVLGKYLVFGVSAAVIGCIAGILMALGLSGFVLKQYQASGMYQFGLPKSVVTPGLTAGACILMIAICAAATVIACSGILRSPASILMKGGTIKKNSGYRKKTSSGRSGSLYSRLIIRNMLDDKARVAISIVIIAFSTLLVGIGISMKLAYDGMSTRQVSDVYKYDVRVDLGDRITDADKQKMEEVMSSEGADYLPASYETHIFHLGDRLDALYVLTADPEKLGGYFAVNDPKTGEALEIPQDGVLAQKKMRESYGLGEGSTIRVLNSGLDECEADVKGEFQNYVGRVVITSPEGYRNIFGEEPVYNCYYVKAGSGGVEALRSGLLAVSDDVSFEVSADFARKFESVSFLYNLIVYVTTGIAILMSFMILSNLANIFLNRKKTELTVMRINGFSIKQTKGYLSKETVVTTIAGLVLGVVAGSILTPFVIRTMEQPDLQFIRSFHPVAWVAAVALEALFAAIINGLVFRKVKDLNFRDVA